MAERDVDAARSAEAAQRLAAVASHEQRMLRQLQVTHSSAAADRELQATPRLCTSYLYMAAVAPGSKHGSMSGRSGAAHLGLLARMLQGLSAVLEPQQESFGASAEC